MTLLELFPMREESIITKREPHDVPTIDQGTKEITASEQICYGMVLHNLLALLDHFDD